MWTVRLLKVVYYSECIGFGGFTVAVGNFLAYANLSNAYLHSVGLAGADFSNANLSGVQFTNAFLFGVDFSNANLTNVNFSEAYLADANLSEVTWNEGTNWYRVQGLETAKNVPIALKQQLGLE